MEPALVLSLGTAVLLALMAEALAVPRAPLRRSSGALSLHALSVSFVWLCILLPSGRPCFSAFVAVALIGLMAAVSNAKYESLREPFVFTDLSLFAQLFSHPRLYLPFLGAGKIVAIAMGVAVTIAAYHFDAPRESHAGAAGILAACACLVAGYALAARLPLTLEPSVDQRRHGFFTVFVAYLLNGVRPATFRAFRQALRNSPFADGRPLHGRPDVIVVQSESFFDIRQAVPTIDAAILAHYDAAVRDCVEHGELFVPAWGANTMRTEFSLLSGVPSAALGYARFYPYAFLRRACPTLAGWFKRASYRTLAIHPYYADFFGRRRVFPLMHFDRLADIEAFANAPRAGPYVADDAIVDRIIAELDAPRDSSSFIFAMTMENHGPLHLEKVAPGEAGRWHGLGEDAAWRDLTVYLRHIANADAMIGRLIAYLKSRRRDTVLCFYGDHVPALPHIFKRLGSEPGHSHFFIWRNFGERPARHRDRSVDGLGAALADALETESRCRTATRPSENTSRI